MDPMSQLIRVRLSDATKHFVDLPLDCASPELLKEVFGIAKVSFLRRGTSIYVHSNGRWMPNLAPGEYLLNQPLLTQQAAAALLLADAAATTQLANMVASAGGVKIPTAATLPRSNVVLPSALSQEAVHVAGVDTSLLVSSEPPPKRRRTVKTGDLPYKLYEDPINEKERLWNLHAPEVYNFSPSEYKNEKAIRSEFKHWYDNYHTIVGACNQVLEIQKRRITTWTAILRAGKKVKDLAIKIAHTETELAQVEGRVDRVCGVVEAILQEQDAKPVEERFAAKVMFFNRLKLDSEYAKTLLTHAKEEMAKIALECPPMTLQIEAPPIADAMLSIDMPRPAPQDDTIEPFSALGEGTSGPESTAPVGSTAEIQLATEEITVESNSVSADGAEPSGSDSGVNYDGAV